MGDSQDRDRTEDEDSKPGDVQRLAAEPGLLRRSSDQLWQGVGRGAGALREGASSVAETVSSGASVAVDSASSLTHHALTAMAADPTRDPVCEASLRERTTRQVLEMLPIVGATTAYADARAQFQLARKIGDDALLRESRSGCLYACAIMGIDVLTLAPGALARGGAWVTRASHVHFVLKRFGSLPPLRLLARINRLPGVSLSPASFVSRRMMEPAIRQILRADFATRVMDELLSVALPKPEDQP